jgi:predicted nucleic acid-binding protein
MKKKLYIETSVWNQLYKSNRPDWNSITEKFMNMVRKSEGYEIYISNYVLIEIEECYEEKRKVLLKWIQKISPILLDDSLECETMMAKYFEAGILEPSKANRYYDAAHVAVCSVNNIEYLLTFNFKHLVKIKKIDSFNGVNLLNGYGSLNFVNPEMFIPEEA